MNERDTLKINTEGKLEIGGLTCTQLKAQFGTPLYCMDQKYIENMCSIYDKTLQEKAFEA